MQTIQGSLLTELTFMIGDKTYWQSAHKTGHTFYDKNDGTVQLELHSV